MSVNIKMDIRFQNTFIRHHALALVWEYYIGVIMADWFVMRVSP
jgi:hypothetical protein